jgi:hypothetical protein
MKKTTMLCIIFLMTYTTNFAFVTESKNNQKTQNLTFETFLTLSPEAIKQKTGQNLTFTQKIGLKILQRKLKKAMPILPSDCSKIVMKDGDVIEANIIQINPTEIKYKRCGKPNDPEIVINKKDVLSIKAADGEIIFRNTGNNNVNDNSNNNNSNTNNNRDNNYGTNNNNQNNNNNEPKLQGSALAGMICGILGVLFLGSIIGLALGIVGLVLSIIGRKKINNDPKNFKGKGMAMAGLICGIVACGLFVIALL